MTVDRLGAVRRVLLLFGIFLYSVTAASADKDVLTVAAAANLASSLPALHEAFERQHPEVIIKAVTGSSGALTAQILNGAPFDVFLSADMAYPRRIFDKGGAPLPPKRYAEGILVLVSAYHQPAATVEEFIRETHGPVIIPNPRVAPYGAAAVEFLESIGAYSEVKSRIAYTENITQTVRMILSTSGIGFISKSALISLDDRKKGDRAYTSYELDPSLHDPILQGCLITKYGQTNSWAQVYIDFLLQGEGKVLLQNLGYRIKEN